MATPPIKPQKILIISNRYPPYFQGGYDLRCKSVADGLKERGYDVQVLTSDWQAPKRQTTGNVHRLLHIREPASHQALYQRWQHVQWALTGRVDYDVTRHLLQAWRPDIVYVWNMGHLSLAPLAAVQELGVPVVFDLGDYWLLQRHQELVQESDWRKRTYRLWVQGIKSFDTSRFTHILVNSTILKQQYIASGFSPEHIEVIPRGLPAHFILDTPCPISPRSTYQFLCAGRLSEAKGIHLAIQTIALLNHPMAGELGKPAQLDIVGDGTPAYMQSLYGLASSLGLQQAIRFVGKVSQEELIDSYKHYDAVLIPSVWVEPFGGITIEAMAQGTCVIASERGGPAEHIVHGRNGILVPPEDPRAMALAVVNLMQDDDLRDRIRRAAIATVRERYALDKVCDQVEAYLEQALIEHHHNTRGR